MTTAPLESPWGGLHSAGIYADMTVDGENIGTLVVVIDRAKNLPNRKSMTKQDPYCSLRLGKEAKKTDTDRRGGQTPKWDQELRFTVHDSPDYHALKVSVFNDDKKTDLIGESFINLKDVIVPGGGSNDVWHHLSCRGKYAGEVRMELTYYDTRPRQPREDLSRSQVSHQRRDVFQDDPRRMKQSRPMGRRPLPASPSTQSLANAREQPGPWMDDAQSGSLPSNYPYYPSEYGPDPITSGLHGDVFEKRGDHSLQPAPLDVARRPELPQVPHHYSDPQIPSHKRPLPTPSHQPRDHGHEQPSRALPPLPPSRSLPLVSARAYGVGSHGPTYTHPRSSRSADFRTEELQPDFATGSLAQADYSEGFDGNQRPFTPRHRLSEPSVNARGFQQQTSPRTNALPVTPTNQPVRETRSLAPGVGRSPPLNSPLKNEFVHDPSRFMSPEDHGYSRASANDHPRSAVQPYGTYQHRGSLPNIRQFPGQLHQATPPLEQRPVPPSPLSFNSIPEGRKPIRKSNENTPEPQSSPLLAYSPDSFNAFNPNMHDRMCEFANGTPYDSPAGAHAAAAHQNLHRSTYAAEEPIIGTDGRVIDPSDHLPTSTWAPEPEPRGQKNLSVVTSSLNPSQQREPVSAESPTMAESNNKQGLTSAKEDSSQSNSPTSARARLQKRLRGGLKEKLQPKSTPPPSSPAQEKQQPQSQPPLIPLATSRMNVSTPPRPAAAPAPLRHYASDYQLLPRPGVNDPRSADNASRMMGRRSFEHRGGQYAAGPPPVPRKIPLQPQQNYMMPHGSYGNDALSEEMSRIDIGAGNGMRGRPGGVPVRGH